MPTLDVLNVETFENKEIHQIIERRCLSCDKKAEYFIGEEKNAVCDICLGHFNKCEHPIFKCNCDYNMKCPLLNCFHKRKLPYIYCHYHSSRCSRDCLNKCIKPHNLKLFEIFEKIQVFLKIPQELKNIVFDFMKCLNGCKEHMNIFKCVKCNNMTKNLYCKYHMNETICNFPISLPKMRYIKPLKDDAIIRCEISCYKSYEEGAGCKFHLELKKCKSCESLEAKIYTGGNSFCYECATVKFMICSPRHLKNPIKIKKNILWCDNFTLTPLKYYIDDGILCCCGGCGNCDLNQIGLRSKIITCYKCKNNPVVVVIDTFYIGKKYKFNNGNPILCIDCIKR